MKRLGTMLLSMILLLGLMQSAAIPVKAEGNFQVSVSPTFGQTEGRKMLAMINAFRQGSDAWYWNSDNSTKTTCSGLGALTYDYGLEQVAMQRAAEIALSFSHTRPNGQSCFSLNATGARAENIAAGYATAAATFAQWQETEKDYSGQGHRRNMLSSSYKYVGIGHVSLNGIHYWVQVFNSNAVSTTATTAKDVAESVTVEIAPANVNKMEASTSPATISLKVGATAAVPGVSLALTLKNAWPQTARTVSVASVWSVSDASVVSLTGSEIKGLKAGKTTLVSTVNGNVLSVPVTVTAEEQKEDAKSSDEDNAENNSQKDGTDDASNADSKVSAKLAKTRIRTLKNTTKGTCSIQLKAVTGLRYQVQYSIKKSMKNAKTLNLGAKTKGTIKNLKKGKTYYFKARTYKKNGTTKTYSKWSARKSVRIKK